MAYHLDAKAVSLDDLRSRLEATDLVPSRALLLDDIGARFEALARQGITTLAELRDGLKTAKRLQALAEATALDPGYLTLLRREIEGYFPKPPHLSAFTQVPGTAVADSVMAGVRDGVARLKAAGFVDAAALLNAASDASARTALASSTGTDPTVVDTLANLSDLTRIQWVSPMAAWMLVESGYRSVDAVAGADTEEVRDAFARVNEGGRFFKGSVGARDVGRLIAAAGTLGGASSGPVRQARQPNKGNT